MFRKPCLIETQIPQNSNVENKVKKQNKKINNKKKVVVGTYLSRKKMRLI